MPMLKGKKGITLIQLLVVIALIVVLAAFIIPVLPGRGKIEEPRTGVLISHRLTLPPRSS